MSSLSRTQPAIEAVTVDAAAVTVTWADDGAVSVFHHIWLRDNCGCALCGPHDRGSRLQRLLDIPDDIAPARAEVIEGALTIVWNGDDHVSEYTPDWLRDRAYSPAPAGGGPRRAPVKRLWSGDLEEWPAVDWDGVLADDAERHRLHASVSELGFVLVRGLGTDRDTIERLAGEVGYVRETHYGRVFDLVTRARPTILADMAGPLLPHTDETYRHVPTGINIFHCIQMSDDGGGASELVDAHHVAAVLAERDPEAYALLTTLPVRHERRIDGQTITASAPAITLGPDGDVTEVRLNERTMTALCVDEQQMVSLYSALRTAFREAYDPRHRITYNLKPGEALIFDNLRVLHGRTGYGRDRWLRQCQVMRDEFYAMGAALAERASTPVGNTG